MDGPRAYTSLVTDGWTRENLRSALHRGEIARPTRGVYDSAQRDAGDLTALFLRLPEGAVLGHQSAARAFGWPVPDDRSIHIVIPAGVVVPRIRGVVTHQAVLPVSEILTVSGVPCVSPARCAVDLARGLRRWDALPLLDAALRSGRCRPVDLTAEVHRHARLRGVCQARRLLDWADGRAECIQESRLRLVLLDGRLPAPEPQIWVDCDGVPLYRIDLGYRDRRVGVEYDGASHLDRDRLRHDRARLNWLADHGWRLRYFTDRDLYRRPRYIVETVRALLR